MAQKRMFDRKVVGSDKFLDLPHSSKALYFIAGMEADDKGFFQPRKIQKMCGFSDDDFKILIAKGFFITFDSGVMVVTDWNKNNWLDSRRITETEYVDELNLLKLINQRYEFKCENELTNDDAKHSLSEYSIVENSIDKNSIDNNYNHHINIYDYIEENFGRTLSPIEYEQVSKWEDNELTRYAIKKAILNGAYRLQYIETILNNYQKNGIKTVQQAQEFDENFRNKSNRQLSAREKRDLEFKELEEKYKDEN